MFCLQKWNSFIIHQHNNSSLNCTFSTAVFNTDSKVIININDEFKKISKEAVVTYFNV